MMAIIDEMSIQDDLVIQKTGDSWSLVGMVDMDSTNNYIDICNGKKKVQLATHALQFVFHGLTGFRWPVAYFGSNTATAHQLCSTYWKLCINYTNGDGVVKLDNIMHDCGQYFKENSMLIPTKDIVARLLPHLFRTVTFFIHEQGKRYVAYRNIVPRMNTSQTSIILPAQCVKSSSMDTEFKLQIPMMTLINGQQEYVEVSFKNDKVKIIVRKLTIEVGLKLEVRQINVDGVVHLASMMKFCNGMEAADNESSELDVEENKIPDIKLTVEDHNDMANILDQIVERRAPENFKIIFESQLQNCRKGLEVHQRRWDPQVISVCLALFLRSSRGYEDFKKSGLLVLLSKRLLQYYKNSIKQTTCFNEDNLKWMKQEANNKQVSEFGKHDGLIIDEMSIQDDLVIQKTGDSWSLVGMVDMDSTNNYIDICNGKKKVQLATHALQFVFHGLTGFRWPVAYFGSNIATAHQLCSTYWKCVDVLDEHGFTVDYMMADSA
ncbi:unnamed protein product [Mytilus coruscus]|uniref:Transposable element P transposase-like RNase H domain-containing protein n=1 Tax=Mytilus coruscus TaxID=42192 RepID=A0A6J8EYT6_MYTCO|nr:unnamed protein product [Mytilus coruscus]